MSREDSARWDGRYGERGPLTPDDVALPRAFAPFADHFPTAGHALELPCGAGAVSVWLARRGLHVWGCDASAVAIAQANELAEQCGQAARCRFDVVDLDDGLPAGEPVDILLCNRFRDPRLDGAMIARIGVGGILAINVLSEVGASPGAFRATPGELVEAFGALDVIACGEGHGEAWLLARAVNRT